jgi:NAD(P)-dependent dehydrogenase (short-subunit alcohol dehydrogenase family)
MPAAVITGGASGFGLALGEQCAAARMDVALLDLDGERVAAEAQRLHDTYETSVLGVAIDVGDGSSVSAAAATVAQRFPAVDLVISNVGVQLFGPVERFTDDEWRWILDVNVIGSARVVRAFLPLLRNADHGRLAFTTSSSVLDPAARLGAYQATKFAVWGLAETLRLELAPEGIDVSVILPSGMISRHLETSEAAQPEHVRRPIADAEDFDVMMASNPGMAAMLATPDAAARGVVEAVLEGRHYVITHGDLTTAIAGRATELTAAAEAARSKGEPAS